MNYGEYVPDSRGQWLGTAGAAGVAAVIRSAHLYRCCYCREVVTREAPRIMHSPLYLTHTTSTRTAVHPHVRMCHAHKPALIQQYSISKSLHTAAAPVPSDHVCCFVRYSTTAVWDTAVCSKQDRATMEGGMFHARRAAGPQEKKTTGHEMVIQHAA